VRPNFDGLCQLLIGTISITGPVSAGFATAKSAIGVIKEHCIHRKNIRVALICRSAAEANESRPIEHLKGFACADQM
jgi:hypothetical protein